MVRPVVAALVLTGCDVIFPLREPPVVDAPVEVVDMFVPPDISCFGTDIVQLCIATPPTTPLDVPITAGALVINTDDADKCLPYETKVPAVDPMACVIAATTITVRGTLRAIGSRTLVLAASVAIEITGTVDVSSSRLLSVTGPGAIDANSGPDCGFVSATQGGGGPGGSFGGRGGNGGNGGSPVGGGGDSILKNPTNRLRGGCRGGGGGGSLGTSGDGGGGVALIAPAIAITATGTITASGGGGGGGIAMGIAAGGGGGGGGGSGGMIVLDGTLAAETGSTMYANGGGGGEGAGNTAGNHGCDGEESPGLGSPGRGGGGRVGCDNLSGGSGGSGSDSAVLIGGPGIVGTTSGGGGGGGGGAGVIRVVPNGPQTAGQFSPPPS